MIALDASVLIALLETGHQHHQRAKEFLSAAVAQPWAINVPTLAEVMVAPAKSGRLPQGLHWPPLMNGWPMRQGVAAFRSAFDGFDSDIALRVI